MSSIHGIISTTHQPLSLKAACIGFVASTALMIGLMMIVGNLAA